MNSDGPKETPDSRATALAAFATTLWHGSEVILKYVAPVVVFGVGLANVKGMDAPDRNLVSIALVTVLVLGAAAIQQSPNETSANQYKPSFLEKISETFENLERFFDEYFVSADDSEKKKDFLDEIS